MEKVIETKTCKNCQIDFHITDQDLEFYEKVSPVFEWKKYQILSPTLCPDCRQQRRISWRNEKKLYKRICDYSWEEIISTYSPDNSLKVYAQEIWWSDKWNAFDYGIAFDLNTWFFTQFSELLSQVPQLAIINKQSINCEYTHISQSNKNCYMITESSDNEESLFSYWIQKSSYAIDSCYSTNSQHIYECLNCDDSYNLYYSINCVNCHDCIWCIDLYWESYHIFNKKYTKEEYESKKKEILQAGSLQLREKLVTLGNDKIHKYIIWNNIEHSSWNYLYNTKNTILSYDCKDIEDSKFSYNVMRKWANIYDCDTAGFVWELLYESINTWLQVQRDLFCNRCWTVSDALYSYNCDNSSYIFGCIWLRNAQYCILNKQYTKEQYENLVPKIIEKMKEDWEWWEFLPSSMSPFGYNETVANEYFPLNKEEALKKWFNWSDYEAPFPKVEKIIPAEKLPEDITDIPDDIINWAIECEITKKPFRIIKPELEFYRKHSLPIPKRHPDQRHMDRMNLRNPRKLYERNCDKCKKDIQTTYAPEREETVYCEECYNQEIY